MTMVEENSVFRLLEEQEFPFWDDFVSLHPKASIYHFSIWRHIVGQGFKKRWYVIAAIQEGRIRAGIPLVHMKSPMFGNFLVSLPYVNYGGLLIEDESHLEPLVKVAKTLAQSVRAEHIEFRHLENFNLGLPAKVEKVSMWLELPGSSESLLAGFKPKLRSQVRKGEKNGLVAHNGSGELLDPFYEVFAANMRDLGTPVYDKKIFQLILEAFPKTARIIVVYDPSSTPIAAGFLLGFRDRLEIPWASSLRVYNHLQSNMFLYWNCLKYACDEGYGKFDFGRSSKGSSTYKFKEQWGARPVPHYWHYYLQEGQILPQVNPQNPKYQMAIRCWQHLPLSVSKILGPFVARHLP